MESFSIVMQLYSILRKAELSGDTAGKFAPVARRRMPENLPFVLAFPTPQLAASPQPAVMAVTIILDKTSDIRRPKICQCGILNQIIRR